MSEAVPPHTPAARLSSQVTPRPYRRLDRIAIALVLGFAFLAGSFTARNSDVWLHLATGRMIVAGNYHFGVDPFAYTTSGHYWANHAWLFDVVLFLSYQWVGGAGLVAMKAAAVAATAGIMLYAARGSGPVWVSAGCVLLAVAAMSPRLLLQPSIASLLLLAACLGCLRRGGRALAAVPVLIAVWVNVDSWFILGPALVILYWLGSRLDPDRRTLPAWPAWLLPASLAACLLSPHHIHALQLPMELSPAVWASAFPDDPRFSGVFQSPWRLSSLGAAGGYNLAVWAFLALLGLGLASFVANRRAVLGWRMAVWLPFALLAVWQSRLIPFFAVVAGPISALNLGDQLSESCVTRWGRRLVPALAAVLVGLAWMGWTTGFSNRERGASWALYTDPTLERTALGIAQWREANHPAPDVHVFATHSDLGHYLAWNAPGERSFLDSRLPLFTGVASDFAALGDPGHARFAELLRTYSIGGIVLHDPDAGRMTRLLRELPFGSNRWEIARIDGASVLLVPEGSLNRRMGFDAESAVFGPGGEVRRPQSGPARLSEPPFWWAPSRGRGRTGSWEADAATVYLRLFENGTAKSPALPYLAIRACRVGIEIDPSDAVAWLTLGRAYSLLGERTWESESGASFTLLENVRIAQITTALVQAALLNPGSIAIRESLARVFLRRNMYDLAYLQASEALRLMRQSGPLAGESLDSFASRTARLAAVVEPLEAALLDAENRYLIRSESLAGDPLARAQIAVELGLTRKAIDILLNSHPDLYGAPGLGLLADLLLQTGQAAECRVLLDRAELRRNTHILGVYSLPRHSNPDGYQWPYLLPYYEWLDLCQRLASGDYRAATTIIDQLCVRYGEQEQEQSPLVAASCSARLALEAGLAAPPMPLLAQMVSLPDRMRVAGLIARAKSLTIIRADLTALSGILSLECGHAPDAARRFEAALALYGHTKALGLFAPGAALAERYNDVIRRAN